MTSRLSVIKKRRISTVPRCPLTPAFSPSEGERGSLSLCSDWRRFSLSPAEGERAGVRGNEVALSLVVSRCTPPLQQKVLESSRGPGKKHPNHGQ